MDKTLDDKKDRLEFILEGMHSDIKLILEHTTSLRELPPKVDKIAEDLETVKDDVAALKVGHASMQQDISVLKQDVRELKTDMKEVKQDLKQKVDRKEFDNLKRAIAHL